MIDYDPLNDTGPAPTPQPKDEPKKEEKKPRLGRVYVTYTKHDPTTGLTYSGRTSMVVDLNKPMRPQAIAAMARRDAGHHIKGNYGPAQLDRYAVGLAVNYEHRYQDLAYYQIRGREQQMIDANGGAWSDTNQVKKSGNPIRGTAKDHPLGAAFHAAATLRFGPKHAYTGD